MRKELDDALVRDFPNLYSQRHWPMSSTCMYCGFSCGDGWEPLIRRLSEKLEPMGVVATQVKQKFGGLRFYLESWTDEAEKAISEAEKESEVTCEKCGKPGKLTGKYWLTTLCPECESRKNG